MSLRKDLPGAPSLPNGMVAGSKDYVIARAQAAGLVGPVAANAGGDRRGAHAAIEEMNELVTTQARAFVDFRAQQDDRYRELQGAVDDIAGRVAAAQVGAGGAASFGNTRQAFAGLHGWMRGAPQAGMHTSSDPDGGYTTAPELDPVIHKHMDDLSPMRRVARVVSTRSGEFSILFSTGEAGSGWVGERESRPETSHPPLGKITIPAHELYCNPSATQTLLDDSDFDIDGFLRSEILREFARQEGEAFITGDGISKPRGLLTYDTATTDDATRAFGTLQYVASGASGAFAASDPSDVLISLVYKLKAGYRRSARWMMNSSTAATIRKFKDADGRYIWSDPLSQGQPPLLLGFPVELDENMPDVAANSLSIAFGDFRAGYTIADRLGVRLLRDPYTNKPYVMFYTTKRVGGGLVDSKAIKLLKFAAS